MTTIPTDLMQRAAKIWDTMDTEMRSTALQLFYIYGCQPPRYVPIEMVFRPLALQEAGLIRDHVERVAELAAGE